MFIMGSINDFYDNLKGTISGPLLVIFLISITLLFLTNHGSSIPAFLCERGICFRSKNPSFWNDILNTFAAGGAISVLFYWLLVQWPEYLKRRRVKRNLAIQYRLFKTSCIEKFLAVADNGFPDGRPELLIRVEAFRDYFNEDIGDNKRRWHDVHNNMSDYYLKNTLSNMEILRQEISLAMHAIMTQ